MQASLGFLEVLKNYESVIRFGTASMLTSECAEASNFFLLLSFLFIASFSFRTRHRTCHRSTHSLVRAIVLVDACGLRSRRPTGRFRMDDRTALPSPEYPRSVLDLQCFDLQEGEKRNVFILPTHEQ